MHASWAVNIGNGAVASRWDEHSWAGIDHLERAKVLQTSMTRTCIVSV